MLRYLDKLKQLMESSMRMSLADKFDSKRKKRRSGLHFKTPNSNLGKGKTFLKFCELY